jgi:hypothetical protein
MNPAGSMCTSAAKAAKEKMWLLLEAKWREQHYIVG